MDFVKFLRAQRDRVVAWTLIAGGGACLVAGWAGVSGTRQVYEQLTYLVSGALVGLFLLALGIALLLSADFHDEWRKLDRIDAALRALASESDDVVDTIRGNATVATAGEVRAGPTAVPLRRELGFIAPGLLIAVALLGIAWTKSSGSNDPQVGADALIFAVYGLFACGVTLALSSRRLRRIVRQRKAALLGSLVAPADDTGSEPSAPAAEIADGHSSTGFFVAESGRRYHRPECPVLASQRAVPATATALRGYVACQLCDAEQRT